MSRTYGSGRGACHETHVPTATPPRVHHSAGSDYDETGQPGTRDKRSIRLVFKDGSQSSTLSSISIVVRGSPMLPLLIR
jgi:hypothetical protein